MAKRSQSRAFARLIVTFMLHLSNRKRLAHIQFFSKQMCKFPTSVSTLLAPGVASPDALSGLAWLRFSSGVLLRRFEPQHAKSDKPDKHHRPGGWLWHSSSYSTFDHRSGVLSDQSLECAREVNDVVEHIGILGDVTLYKVRTAGMLVASASHDSPARSPYAA